MLTVNHLCNLVTFVLQNQRVHLGSREKISRKLNNSHWGNNKKNFTVERAWNTAFGVKRGTACRKKTFDSGGSVAYCTPHLPSEEQKQLYETYEKDGTENDGKGETGE